MKRRSRVMLGLVALGCIPGEAVADLPILVGSDAAADNLLDIDFTTGNGSVIGPLDDDVVAGLAFDPNHHILYGSSTVTDHLLKIDPATGATVVIGAFGVRKFTMHALAYDSSNDLLYGAQEKQDGSKGSELYQIDVKTAAASLVGANDVVDFVGGMAFDPINDVMYLSDPADGLLWTIDLTNGSVDLVGSFGVGGAGIAVGLAYHPDVGLVASHNHFNADIDDELFMIDSDTGQASLIGPIEAGNVTGLTFTLQPIATFLDIKPGSCPNPLNRSSHGMMPAAILGTDDFDASQIDVSSVMLSRADGIGGSVAPNEGPPGPHSVLEDVGTPFDEEPCDCHEVEGDGFVDLSMHFVSDEVVDALQLNDLPNGDLVEIIVTGALLDGTEFSASDCIRLVPPGTPPGLLTVESNLPGVWIDVAPLDPQLDSGGFASFERTYPLGSVVTLVAPQTYQGWSFAGWKVGSLLVPRTTVGLQSSQSIDIVIFADHDTIQAVFYAPLSSVDSQPR